MSAIVSNVPLADCPDRGSGERASPADRAEQRPQLDPGAKPGGEERRAAVGEGHQALLCALIDHADR